jgi:hypothetical protein
VNFLKRLFCWHRGPLRFERSIYGDEINYSGGSRSLWTCVRCQGLVAKKHLRTPTEPVLVCGNRELWAREVTSP